MQAPSPSSVRTTPRALDEVTQSSLEARANPTLATQDTWEGPSRASFALPLSHAGSSTPPTTPTTRRHSAGPLTERLRDLDASLADAAAFASKCHAVDMQKAAGLTTLAKARDVHEAARALASLVETLHGVPGQTRRAEDVAQRLLSHPPVRQCLEREAPTPQCRAALALDVHGALAYLSLGDVEGAAAFYLLRGRPSDEAKTVFAGRYTRAAALMQKHGIGSAGERALVRNLVAPPCERSLGAQLVDISKRIAAMTADRPQRQAVANDIIALDLLRGDGKNDARSPASLGAAAADAVLSGVFDSLRRQGSCGRTGRAVTPDRGSDASTPRAACEDARP